MCYGVVEIWFVVVCNCLGGNCFVGFVVDFVIEWREYGEWFG